MPGENSSVNGVQIFLWLAEYESSSTCVVEGCMWILMDLPVAIGIVTVVWEILAESRMEERFCF